MTPLTAALLAQLLPACPLCSYRKSDHPELDRDYLRMPAAVQGRAGKRWRLLDGCVHSQRLPGNALGWATQEQAEEAWRNEAARLGAEHVNTTAELVRSANRTIQERVVAQAQERALREACRREASRVTEALEPGSLGPPSIGSPCHDFPVGAPKGTCPVPTL